MVLVVVAGMLRSATMMKQLTLSHGSGPWYLVSPGDGAAARAYSRLTSIETHHKHALATIILAYYVYRRDQVLGGTSACTSVRVLISGISPNSLFATMILNTRLTPSIYKP